MVRTGARAQALRELLQQIGLQPVAAGPPAPRLDALPAAARTELAALYQDLGGTDPMPTLRTGAWDLGFADGLVVELDEELHFNRYRLRTLEPRWAVGLPWRDAYRDFSDRHESGCLAAGKWGKRWTNPSCESMFGPAGAPGTLDGAGAPRWKQRALYDAVKDIATLNSHTIRLARLSVWDTVGKIRIGDALTGSAPIDLDQLGELVEQRTTPVRQR